MISQREELRTLLLDCLHHDGLRVERSRLASLSNEEWHELLATATALGVRLLLEHRLKASGVAALLPAPVAAAWKDRDRRAVSFSLMVTGALRRALGSLREDGVAVIVMKGALLAYAVYEHPALRPMGDIDLLVKPSDLQRAARVLQNDGYEARAEAGDHRCHLPPFVKPGAPEIDVHWRLSPPTTALPADDLWERAVPVRVAGVEALGLCTEDLLLQVTAHASYRHYFAAGLRPFCDIAEVLWKANRPVDWAAVARRARRCEWQRGVYLCLRLARDTVGAAVPDDVLRALEPDGFSAALIDTARFVVMQDAETNRSMTPTIVALSAATTWRARTVHVLRRVFAPRALVAMQYGLPPGSVRVLLYYPARLRYLLRRYGRVAIRLWRGDAGLHSIARRKGILQTWLAGGPR